MFVNVKMHRMATLCLVAWILAGCAQESPTPVSEMSTLKAAAVNVLAGTRWTECRYILSIGRNYYFNKRMFDFTADGRMRVSALAIYSDTACKSEVSAQEFQKVAGNIRLPTGNYEHRYRVASGPDADGVYDFDQIVYSQTTYTSMKIEGNHLMIGSAYNRDTEDPNELAMTGGSPETRAYAIGKLPLYYSLYRLP